MTRTIAIDGPSGAGKSTIGHALAKRIDATFVDTGLMYRALTLAALKRGIDVDDGLALGALATECLIEVERLVRVRIGSLTLAGLREGEWRRLRRSEVSALSGSRPR